MSSMIISGTVTICTSKELAEKLEELVEDMNMEYCCSVETQEFGEVLRGAVEVSFYFEGETGYSFADEFEELMDKVHELCDDYPEGYVIEDTEGEGIYRLEVNHKTGEVTEKRCDWLTEYDNDINEACQKYADELEKLQRKQEEKDVVSSVGETES